MKAATCKYCEATIEYYGESIGWVDVVSGEHGGTYDYCPDSPRDDIEDKVHEPTSCGYGVILINRDDEREVYAADCSLSMDSAIRQSVKLVREHAQKTDMAYFAEPPIRDGDTYRQIWECEDAETAIEAIVTKSTE